MSLGEKKEPERNPEENKETEEMKTTQTPKENPKEEIIKEQTTAPIDPNKIVITEANVEQYQIEIQSLEKLPGSINLWLTTKDLKQIPNVISYLRDQNGKIVYANKTGPNGYFLTNKQWEEGVYTGEFQHPQYKFPKVEIVLTKNFTKKPY